MAGKAAAGDADEARIRATVRVLSVGQLLRTAQYGISSMVVNQTALGLCGGNHAVVVAHIARAGTLGSLLELLSSPFFGKVTDALGRKPVLLLAGTAKLIPYLLLLISPSMGAIFALNAVQEVAYQMYRLSDQSILADIIKDPKRLAVAQTETSSMMGGALIFGNLLGGYLASTNPKVPLMIAAGCNLAFAGIVSLGLTETHKPSLPIPIPDSPLRKSCSQEGFYLPVLPATKTPEAHARGAVARLLCSGRVLRLLTISNVLTSVVDLTWTIRSVMALQRLGMSSVNYGVWEACNGVILLSSGKATALMLRYLDVQGFNLVAHSLSLIRQLMTAFAYKPAHLYLTLVPEMFGGEGVRVSTLRALHTRAAIAAGMGIGEAGAALRTLQSISGMIATTAFGLAYQRNSRWPWLLAAVFAVLGEGVFLLLGRKELEDGTRTP